VVEELYNDSEQNLALFFTQKIAPILFKEYLYRFFMENLSENIGEEVILQLKELINLIERKINQNGNKQDNSCGLHRIHENTTK